MSKNPISVLNRMLNELLYVLGLPYVFVGGFFGFFLNFLGLGFNPFLLAWVSGVVMNIQRYFRFPVLRRVRLGLFGGYALVLVWLLGSEPTLARGLWFAFWVTVLNLGQVLVFYVATYRYDFAKGQRGTEINKNQLVEWNRKYGGGVFILFLWGGYLLWRGSSLWGSLVQTGLTYQLFFVACIFGQLFGLWWLYWRYGHEDKSVRVDKPAYEAPDLQPWEMEYILREGRVDVERTFLAYVVTQAQEGELVLAKDETVQIKNLENSLPDIQAQTKNIFGQHSLRSVPLYGAGRPWRKAIGEWLDTKGFFVAKPPAAGPWVIFGLALLLSVLPSVAFWSFGPPLTLMSLLAAFHQKLNSWQKFGLVFAAFISFLVSTYLYFVLAYDVDTYDRPDRLISLLSWSLIVLIPLYTLVWAKFGRLSTKGLYYYRWAKQYAYYIEYVEKEMLNTRNTVGQGLQRYNKHLPYAAQLGYLPNLENWLQQQVAEARGRYT